MYTRRIIAFLMTLPTCLLFYTGPGFAQYWMETQPGFKLEPVDQDSSVLIGKADPLLETAGEVAAVRLDALFRVQPGMSRFFTEEWDDDAQAMRFVEQAFVPNQPVPGDSPELIPYAVDGLQVLIGIGQPDTDDGNWAPREVVSLGEGRGGDITVLDSWELGAQYCAGIYIFDVLHDGSLCLVAPWATGAGGGGGVDVLWLSPAGMLTPFGPDEEYASIWSQNGYVNLLDYNGDGVWEIETAFPLMFTASGYSYKEILSFDPDSWAWVGGDSRFQDFYAPEDAFYRILIAKARDMEQDTSKYKVDNPGWEGAYGFKLDGEWYSLEPFVDWETGEFNATWLTDLEAIFEP